jgi:hypothetical protein
LLKVEEEEIRVQEAASSQDSKRMMHCRRVAAESSGRRTS